MKIVVLDGHTLNPGDLSWDALSEISPIEIYDNTASIHLLERAQDAEIILTNKVAIDADHIAQLPVLKYIGVLATGYNVVDVKAAKKAGVCVTNVPGYGIDSVAQHTLALMLELTNNVGLSNASVRQGEWADSPYWCYWKKPMTELAGKTLGIIGLGAIGSKVATLAQAFGMKIIYNSRQPKDFDGAEFVDLSKLFANSDIVSLHTALTGQNAEIINNNSMKSMKKASFLINTSRGGLINENDLANALNNNEIAGAALDVLSSEPPNNDNPLLKAKNCIITPHNAWATKESRGRLMEIAVRNVVNFIAGNPNNIVN